MSWEDDDFQLPPLVVENYTGSVRGAAESAGDAIPWESEKTAQDFLEAHYTGNEFKKLEGQQGQIDAPDAEQLTDALNLECEKSPFLLAKEWICTECSTKHEIKRNFILDTQKFGCPDCSLKNPSSYAWSLTRCKLNGVSLDFTEIYDQDQTDHCVLYSFLSLCDMSRRVRGARFGCDEGSKLDAAMMLDLYNFTAGSNLSGSASEPSKGLYTEIMLKAAVFNGVPYSCDTLYDIDKGKRFVRDLGQDRPIPLRSLKLLGWFKIEGSEIDKITRLIAHGVPLLARIHAGKRFALHPDGPVYYAPDPINNAALPHQVVLHGTGVAQPQKDLTLTVDLKKSVPCEVFYRCRDSTGEDTHYSVEDKGADFNVWAVDIIESVYGVILADVDSFEARRFNYGG